MGIITSLFYQVSFIVKDTLLKWGLEGEFNLSNYFYVITFTDWVQFSDGSWSSCLGIVTEIGKIIKKFQIGKIILQSTRVEIYFFLGHILPFSRYYKDAG